MGEGVLPGDYRFCTRVVLDPANSERIYVTFGGYHRDNVWRTENGGKSWENLGSKSLPEAPVFSLAIHPHNPRWLYIGTEVGVFGSEDGGKTWSPTNEGPANCRVDELLWMDDWLVAATHARGLFRIDLTLARP